MPSLTIFFTDDELRQLREAAERENVSLEAFAHAAAIAAASSTKRQIAEAATRVAAVSAELNRRLS
ncbi:MAG: antitoxin Phd [Rhodococcus sp. (in: high G+C Gram-positive bacteria)]|uniref:antitoxin Phd n=1 Tax=Rhodococcus sp. TaxID=1831 RepID=UPI003BB656E7